MAFEELLENTAKIMKGVAEEYYEKGRKDATEDIKLKIGFLRQFINEMPSGRLITNEDIKAFLKIT